VGGSVAAVALFNLALTTSAGVFTIGHPPSRLEQVFWAVAVTVPLTVRRRWPDAVALVIAVAFIACQVRAAPEQQVASGALFAAIYTVGAWGRDHRRSVRIRAVVIAAMFVWLTISYVTSLQNVTADTFPGAAGPIPPLIAAAINGVLLNVLVFGFAYFFGEIAWIGARREHLLEVQAEQLRASQAEAGERAVLGERVRIARELHDVVAHHVSVMGVQASAGRRVLDKDPAKAKIALAAVEQSARTAVDELRRMLSLLRRSDVVGGEPHAAGIERVDDLLAGTREAGLTTNLGVYGDPVPLPQSLSQAAYRIVQEALTNTLKHAGAATVDVRIRYLANELEVDVTDDGRGGRSAARDGGLGLIGMRERVAAHDGVLEAGPRTGAGSPSGAGFRVRARFPLSRQTADAA
jgi:signal transduction histidine kinase